MPKPSRKIDKGKSPRPPSKGHEARISRRPKPPAESVEGQSAPIHGRGTDSEIIAASVRRENPAEVEGPLVEGRQSGSMEAEKTIPAPWASSSLAEYMR
jgi:hypothetical protein